MSIIASCHDVVASASLAYPAIYDHEKRTLLVGRNPSRVVVAILRSPSRLGSCFTYSLAGVRVPFGEPFYSGVADKQCA